MRKLGSESRRKNRNPDEKLARKTGKKSQKNKQNHKTKERHWIMWKKNKRQHEKKITVKIEEINMKVQAKEGT